MDNWTNQLDQPASGPVVLLRQQQYRVVRNLTVITSAGKKGTYVPICTTRVTVDSDRGNCTAYNRMFVDWPPDAEPNARDVTRSD